MIIKYYRYFFYFIYTWYISKEEKDIPGLYALSLITLMLCLNILTLFIVSLILFVKPSYSGINSYYGYVLFAAVYCFNWLYFYTKKRKNEIFESFSNSSNEEKNKLKKVVLLYMGFSLVSIITAMAIYLS